MGNWIEWDGKLTPADIVSMAVASVTAFYVWRKDRAERRARLVVSVSHSKAIDPVAGTSEDVFMVTLANDSKRTITVSAIQSCRFLAPYVWMCLGWILPQAWMPRAWYMRPPGETVFRARQLPPDHSDSVVFELPDDQARLLADQHWLFCSDQFGNRFYASRRQFAAARKTIKRVPAERATRQEGPMSRSGV